VAARELGARPAAALGLREQHRCFLCIPNLPPDHGHHRQSDHPLTPAVLPAFADGPLGAAFDARLAQATSRLSLPSPGSRLLLRPISPDLNVLATAPAVEPGLALLDGPVVMTGPCLPRAAALDEAGRAVLAALPSGARSVHVSLGTVFNEQPAVFRTLIDGAAATGAHVLVSAGASLEALGDLRAPRVQLFRRVPQVPVLARVDVVITHGGNNTVQECLAAGRPMVVIPFGGDQLVNARRVERLGVGVRLDARSLSSAAVHDVLASVSTPSVVERARAVAATLSEMRGAAAAADAVLELALR
jgi:MGT family glycosyltransferase